MRSTVNPAMPVEDHTLKRHIIYLPYELLQPIGDAGDGQFKQDDGIAGN